MKKSSGEISPQSLQKEAPEFFKFLETLFPFQDIQKHAIIKACYHDSKFEEYPGHIYKVKFYSNDLFFVITYVDGEEEVSEKDAEGYTTGKTWMVRHNPTVWFESGYRTSLPGEKEKRVKKSWQSLWNRDSQRHITHLIVSGNMKQLKSKSDLDDDYYPVCIPINESELFEKFLGERYPYNGTHFWRISNEDPEGRYVSVSFEINFYGSHVNSFNMGAAWVKYRDEHMPNRLDV